MRRKIPSTAALVSFEAAARHESFLRAAEELAITPGAVSRQIKTLEAELAVRLFERYNRAVRLTDEGRRLSVGVGQGLGLMQEAVAAFSIPSTTSEVLFELLDSGLEEGP